MSRVDGSILLEQDKLFGFEISAGQLSDWGLSSILGTNPLGEYMRRGAGLAFAESALGRLVVLVCEDLGRVFDVGATVRSFGTSHLLAPVFSKPTIEFYWEHQRAREYTAELGATTIVANSLAVARAMGRKQRIGAALVVAGDGAWEIGRATHGNDVLLFTITKAGEVTIDPVVRG
jgi:hypothetical protein